jgi:protein required for attachment to host cells
MSKMKIGTGDWIVVCDGRKALILENVGDRLFPNCTREVREHPDPSTSAQGSDAPGRVHVAVTTGETTALTMVASPRALGMIRSDYSVAVRKALHGELGKDLVKMPDHEIEKQLLS